MQITFLTAEITNCSSPADVRILLSSLLMNHSFLLSVLVLLPLTWPHLGADPREQRYKSRQTDLCKCTL